MRFAAVLFVLPWVFQPWPLPSRLRSLRGCAPPDWANRYCLRWWTPPACRDEWEQTKRWTSRARGVSDRVIAAAIRRAAADEARALLPPEPVVEQTPLEAIPLPEPPVVTEFVPVPVVPWVALPVVPRRPHGPAKPTLGTTRDLAGSSTRISVR
jgi:hypothetical protein